MVVPWEAIHKIAELLIQTGLLVCAIQTLIHLKKKEPPQTHPKGTVTSIIVFGELLRTKTRQLFTDLIIPHRRGPRKSPPVFLLAYSSGIPAALQALRVSSSQMVACTSPMWALPMSSMHRRLWPMPPPMDRGSTLFSTP